LAETQGLIGKLRRNVIGLIGVNESPGTFSKAILWPMGAGIERKVGICGHLGPTP